MNRTTIIFALLSLAACTQSPSTVRITNDEPTLPKPIQKAAAKSEPVFYNGKTYQVDIAPLAGSTYAVAISGMSAAQAKEAAGLTTSAFHHFTCKDTQKATLIGKPAYNSARWNLTAKCS